MKKGSKVVAALFAACMLCSLSAAVSAQEIPIPPSGNTGAVNTLSLPGQPAYTVTIPPEIPVGDIVKTAASSIKSTPFTVSVAETANLDGKKVDISISTENDSFTLSDGSDHTLPYQVFNQAAAGTPLTSGGLFASFTADGAVTGRVDIDQADIEAAGSYTGTLTFTIMLNSTVS